MNIVRTGSIEEGSNIITDLARTDDLNLYLKAYGNGILPCSQITEITDETSIKIGTNAEKTGSISITFTEIPTYKYIQQCEAKKVVSDIIAKEGMLINISLRGESDVVRDSYKSIKERKDTADIWLKSYPIQESPTNEQIEKAGLRETNIGTILYFAVADIEALGYSVNDIDLARSTLKYMGTTYAIREKGYQSQFGNIYLYFTLSIGMR